MTALAVIENFNADFRPAIIASATSRPVCEPPAPHYRSQRACTDVDNPLAGPHVAARVIETCGPLGSCAFVLVMSICSSYAKITIFAQQGRGKSHMHTEGD